MVKRIRPEDSQSDTTLVVLPVVFAIVLSGLLLMIVIQSPDEQVTRLVFIPVVFTSYRIGFGLLNNRTLRFKLCDLGAACVFLACASTAHRLFHSAPIKAALVDGLAFLLTSFLPRAMLAGHAVTGDHGERVVRQIGIIDFVWLMIMGLVCSLLVASYAFDAVRPSAVQLGRSSGYYEHFAREILFGLTSTITVLMALGAVTGVCMTIIWAGRPWVHVGANRPPVPDSAHDHSGQGLQRTYVSTTRSAMAMALAYLGTASSIIIWWIIPLYRNLAAIKDAAP